MASWTRNALLLGILFFSGLFAVGCGEPGSGTDGASASKTGSVSIFVTDAPVDGLQAVNITVSKIELIGVEHATLFEGEETFDLLALREVSELFSSDDAVPAARYWRIRLTLEDMEIVDDGGTSSFPKLPKTGQIDLMPRHPIVVEAGEQIALELDIDLRRSIYFNRDGEYRFRPIVFVRVIDADRPGRLVRLHGRIDAIDLDANTFELCFLRRPMFWHAGHQRHMRTLASGYANSRDSEVADAQKESLHFDGGDDADFDRDRRRVRRCALVRLGDSSSLFGDDGQPTGLSAFAAGDPATVFGRIAVTDEGLAMKGGLVLAGAVGTYTGLRGFVASEVDGSGILDFEIDPAQQGLPAGTTLGAQLYRETKLFSRKGEVISVDDIEVDQRGLAVGVLLLSDTAPDVLRTAIMVVVVAEPEIEPIRGEISAIDLDAGQLTLSVEDAGVTTAQCVDVPDAADIFLVDIENGSSAEVDLADLNVGDAADVYPVSEADSSCVEAGTVIAFPAETEVEDDLV
jgi:hypothetical protein